jgi:peptidoglycan/xylan/chitin deacetylase (PgdA/CDA1 family)
MPPGRVALWVASIGAVALAVRSIVIGVVPLWLALAACAAYLGLTVAGVLVPQLEMFGDVVSRGDPTTRGVALTFDDGPDPISTRRILEILRGAGVTATFFVVGEKAERHPEVIREIVEQGHSIGVHGYTHDRMYAFLPPRAVAEDIQRVVRVVKQASGATPRWFRPPVGQVSPRTSAGARRAGLPIVAWSARGLDGIAGAEAASVARRIERRLEAGAIVLLHDASERDDREPVAPLALPRVLSAIEARALRVVALGELIGDGAE